MFQVLVFEGGLPPQYVLDEMTDWEMNLLLDGIWRKNRDNWEQARLVGYTTARAHMKKGSGMEITKYFPLPWDEGDPEDKPTVTEADKTRLAQRAAEIEKQMALKLKLK